MADLNAELHEQSDESTRSISPVTLALAEGRSLINTQATSAHEYKNKEDEALATRSALPSKMSKEEGENFTEGDRSVSNNKVMNEGSKDETAEGVKDNADGFIFSVSVFKTAY